MAEVCHSYATCPNYSMLHQWGKYANTYATYKLTDINIWTGVLHRDVDAG